MSSFKQLTFSSIAEAQQAKAFLESQGYEVQSLDELSHRTMPHMTTYMGFVRLQVREEDFVKIQHLLSEVQRSQFAIVDPDSVPQSEEQKIEKEVNAPKVALWTAVLGLVLVPVVMNIISIKRIIDSFKKRDTLTQLQWVYLILAILINVGTVIAIPYLFKTTIELFSTLANLSQVSE